MTDPYKNTGDKAAIMHIQCEKFERELTEAQKEIEGLHYALKQSSTIYDVVTAKRDRLAKAIRLTLMENLDLCDGDICTLKRLKDAIGFDLDSEENSQADRPQGSV